MNTTRPTDSSKISFAADCFEIVGERVYYTVSRSALHSGPARFDSRVDAEAYARKTNRSVSEHMEPIRKRVRWF